MPYKISKYLQSTYFNHSCYDEFIQKEHSITDEVEDGTYQEMLLDLVNELWGVLLKDKDLAINTIKNLEDYQEILKIIFQATIASVPISLAEEFCMDLGPDYSLNLKDLQPELYRNFALKAIASFEEYADISKRLIALLFKQNKLPIKGPQKAGKTGGSEKQNNSNKPSENGRIAQICESIRGLSGEKIKVSNEIKKELEFIFNTRNILLHSAGNPFLSCFEKFKEKKPNIADQVVFIYNGIIKSKRLSGLGDCVENVILKSVLEKCKEYNMLDDDSNRLVPTRKFYEHVINQFQKFLLEFSEQIINTGATIIRSEAIEMN